MIITKLKGGLGNQMFQYAIGKTLAKKNNTDLYLDLTFINHRLPFSNYVFRNFDLDIFDIEFKKTKLSQVSPIFYNIVYIFTRLKEKIFTKKYIYEKKIYSYDKNILEQKKENKYLIGYWQSYKYFMEIKDDIEKDFSCFSRPMQEKSVELLNKIKNTDSVCINFRRTDYINNKETLSFHGKIGMDYYSKAIDLITKKINQPHFYIFSDDIKWCIDNIKIKNFPVTFVGKEFSGYKYSDYLQLMTACKHHIIPNSTFAWWSAWLNKNSDKIVIAPKKWVSDPKIETKDIIPETWLTI